MQKETFEVEYEYEGERLDKYVSILFPEQSRSFLQKLIKDGNVSVNDKIQKANDRLKTEDLVTVEIPDAVETQILPEGHCPSLQAFHQPLRCRHRSSFQSEHLHHLCRIRWLRLLRYWHWYHFPMSHPTHRHGCSVVIGRDTRTAQHRGSYPTEW